MMETDDASHGGVELLGDFCNPMSLDGGGGEPSWKHLLLFLPTCTLKGKSKGIWFKCLPW